MLRTKKNVDRHAQEVFRKVVNEHERNLKCFSIAQLYYKVQDYDSAVKYATMYLRVKSDSSTAYKLLGNAYEGQKKIKEALEAYNKSLEIDSNQSELVLKVCELFCDDSIEFDAAKAKFWAEKGSLLNPHYPAVLILKGKLIDSNTNIESTEIEKLLAAELRAAPTNVDARIKILKLYANTKRSKEAYEHVLKTEANGAHSDSLAWYECVSLICKTYFQENPHDDWEMFAVWISALDRVCSLSSNEIEGGKSTIELSYSIKELDQTIFLCSKIRKAPEIYLELINHASAQLAFHLTILLFKKAKKNHDLWKEMKKLAGPLLLFATNDPPTSDGVWSLSLKGSHRKLLTKWSYQGRSRFIQAGLVLQSLSKETQSEKLFLDQIYNYTNQDWRLKIFENIGDQANAKTSHFLTSNFYTKLPKALPSSQKLTPALYVANFEDNYPGSLHHLVWLGLQTLKNAGSIQNSRLDPNIIATKFESIQLTVKNLQNTGVEMLNKLDVDAFLYATIFCTGAILKDQGSHLIAMGKPQLLPVDITESLCTQEQSKWWKFACIISKPTGSENQKMTDIRITLQKGLSIVRNDLPLPLLVNLARSFAMRTTDGLDSDACSARALHYWQKALKQLEQLSLGKTNLKASKFFDYPIKEITPVELSKLLNEGRFFVGSHYVSSKQYEQAIELLKPLKSPQALYYLATAYQKLVEELILNGEPESSEGVSVLVSNAKNALYYAKDLIRDDPSNIFQQKIRAKLIEVNDILPDSNDPYQNLNISFPSMCEPDGDRRRTPPNRFTNSVLTSTPMQNGHDSRYRRNSSASELVELMNMHQNIMQLKVQQVLEHTKIVSDQFKHFSEELLTKMSKLESEVKKFCNKREMNILDEEDYGEEMLHLSPYFSQRANVPQYPRLDPFQNNMSMYNSSLPLSTDSQHQFQQDLLRGNQPLAAFQKNFPMLSNIQMPSASNLQMQPSVPITNVMPAFHPTLPNLSAAQPIIQSSGPLKVPAPKMIFPTNVVITTSDTLPTGTPPVQPTLSVTVPIQHRLGDTQHQYQIPMPVTQPPKPQQDDIEDDDEVIQEYDPMPDFKPIIPLPDEVDVVTGEEDSEILFEARAKLFRFASGDWKERGVGNLKILMDKKTKKPRIVMRREKVLKPCANHFITKDMELTPNSASQTAWVWWAQDFSEQEVKTEQFAVKFKLVEEALQFKEIFYKVKQDLNDSLNKNDSSKDILKSPTLKSPAEQKTPSNLQNISTSLQTTPSNLQTTPSNLQVTLYSKQTPSNQQSPIYSTPMTSFGSTNPVKFTLFGQKQDSVLAAPKFQAKDLSNSTPVFAMPPSAKETEKPTDKNAPTLFSLLSKEPSTGGFSFSSPPVFKASQDVIKPEKSEPEKKENPFAKFSFAVPQDKKDDNSKSSFVFSTKVPEFTPSKTSEAPSFTSSGIDFSFLAKDTPFAGSGFGTKKDTPFSTPKGEISFSSSGPDFASLAKNSGSDFSSLAKSDKFGAITTPTGNIFAGAGSKVFSNKFENKDLDNLKICSPNTNEPKEDETDEFVPTADFKPVIPMPELVKVVSGEEGEILLYEQRAKLFRYSKDTSEWKEKGTGSMKILKNKEQNTIRLLMRREQVLKVCCNHRITKDLKLEPMPSTDKAWTWTAKDYSDDPEGVVECFSLRLKNAETALGFKEAFEKAQSELSDVASPAPKTKVPDEKPSLASFIPKGSWECPGCYIRYGAEVKSCSICTPAEPQKIEGAPSFSFGITPQNQPESLKTNEPAKISFSFGMDKTQQPSFSSPATPSTTGFSFGSSNTFHFGQPSANKSATFQFAMLKTDTVVDSPSKDESDDDHVLEEEANVHFEPVIELPKEVEVKTGEEDEEVLYSHRAKLFRHVAETHEWKERGVGDVKILKHKINGKIRFLMRRDQVKKLCLNHYITTDLKLTPKDEKSYYWAAQDYSEETPTQETFALRFKNEEIANAFLQHFYDAQNLLNAPVAETSEKKEVVPGGDRTQVDTDNDVVYISDNFVSEELRQKALALQLPPNFYGELDRCPGCRGCKEDQDETELKSSAMANFSFSSNQPIRLFSSDSFLNSSSETSIFGQADTK